MRFITPLSWQKAQSYSQSIMQSVFNTLTHPSTKIHDINIQAQARLLSSVILLSLVIIIVLILKPNATSYPTQSNENIILMIAGALLVGLYIVSRSHYYTQTALATVSTLILAVLAIFNISTSGIDYAYLSIVILVASVLLNIRLLLMIIVATMICTLALISEHPEMSLNSEPFIFMLVASVGVVFTGIYRNQLESQRTETLLDRETRLQLILEQMPAILWTTDENLIFTSSTGSGFQQLSVNPETLLGTWIASSPPMDKLSMFRTESHYQALAGQSSTYESSWGDRSFQCFIEPLYDARKNIIGCVGIALDITARRSAEQVRVDLRVEKERVQVLSDFIQNASHDLSTPLSVINASIYLLRNTDEVDKQKRHIDTLELQATRLADLVKSMLTMLQLDKVDTFSKEFIDINHLIDILPHSFETAMQTKRLGIIKDLDDNLPTIEANESYIIQALEEIFDNAVQFSNVGGTITLSTRHDGERAVIEIQDTGIGIGPEDQVRIFERFYRVDKSRSTSSGRTGLGLAIAKRIIDGHAGRIHVQSNVGEGTTIRMYLPLESQVYLAMKN